MIYVWKNNDTYMPHTDMILEYGKKYEISSIRGKVGDYFKVTNPETEQSTYMRYASLVKFRRDWRAA